LQKPFEAGWGFSVPCFSVFNFDLFIACSSSSPEIVTSDSKAIQHPFSPDYYTNNQECQWLVIAPSTHTIDFLLTEVDLGTGDYLVIKDGASDSAVVLRNISKGSPPNNQRASSGGMLFVNFKTDHQNVGKGFKVHLMFQNKRQGRFPRSAFILS